MSLTLDPSRAAQAFLNPPGVPRIDFTQPAGAGALSSPDSVTWRVFKNPLALMIGGVTAVLLELAEPRVRTGVWEHTTFRTDPVGRMRRTGLAAMATVYAPAETARAMIAGISRRHARVAGVTPEGAPYSAADPALLDWVQATASFGFLEAYCAYAAPLPPEEKDRFYAEAQPAAALYGATAAPRSVAEMEAMFQRFAPLLQPHPIVFEFLDIFAKAQIGAPPGFQRLAAKAGVALLPDWARAQLGLGRAFDVPMGARTMLRLLGAAADRFVLKDAPPAQACQRMGLAADYLYR